MFLWAWIKTSWTDAVPGTSPELSIQPGNLWRCLKPFHAADGTSPSQRQAHVDSDTGVLAKTKQVGTPRNLAGGPAHLSPGLLPTPALTLHRGGRAWVSDSLEHTTWKSTSTPQPCYPRSLPPKKRDEAHLTPQSNPQHISEGWQKASGLLWPLLRQVHPWHGPTSRPAKNQAQGAVPGDPAEFLCSQAVFSGKSKEQALFGSPSFQKLCSKSCTSSHGPATKRLLKIQSKAFKPSSTDVFISKSQAGWNIHTCSMTLYFPYPHLHLRRKRTGRYLSLKLKMGTQQESPACLCWGLPGPSHLQPSPCTSFSQPHHFGEMWKPCLPQNTTRSMAASSPAGSGFPLTVIPAPPQIAAQSAAQQHVWLLQHSDKFR